MLAHVAGAKARENFPSQQNGKLEEEGKKERKWTKAS